MFLQGRIAIPKPAGILALQPIPAIGRSWPILPIKNRISARLDHSKVVNGVLEDPEAEPALRQDSMQLLEFPMRVVFRI